MKAITAGIGAILGILASVAVSAQECDRDCLKRHLDAYLTAVTTHKPETGTLWTGFRQNRKLRGNS